MASIEIAAERAGSKRFVRPERLPAFKLTPRVLALLGYIAKHRLISSDDLALLAGGSAQNVKRELRTIWANRYILRPTVQLQSRYPIT
jgi:predicted transcriptional regulator